VKLSRRLLEGYLKTKCSTVRGDEFIAFGQDKTCFLRDRNVSEKIPQRRSWFCPAIGRALGLLSSIALSSPPTMLIVGSQQEKSIHQSVFEPVVVELGA
jgi:hypothetical protein